MADAYVNFTVWAGKLAQTTTITNRKGNKMNILIKIISWFFVIAGLMIIIISASTTDDVDLIYVGALAIVGLATFAFGTILLHRDD